MGLSKTLSKNYYLQLVAIGVLTLGIAFTINKISNRQFLSSKANLSTTPAFRGIQLYKGELAKGNAQKIMLEGSINTGTGAPDLEPGVTIAIGVSSVGNGQVTVGDKAGNVYTLVKDQQIDDSSYVYLFTSKLI